MANYAEIQSVLNEQLSAIPNLPMISYENLQIEPEDDDLYLRSYLIPANSQNPILGASAPTFESGTFAVLVYMVRDTGWKAGYDWVDTIVEQFKRGTVLTNSATSITVRIRKAYPVPGFYGENGRYVVPIHIEYFSYIDI
jgi:hypothetical protein